MSEASGGTESAGGATNQLAYLVPSFDPSKDDLQMYQQKVQLVLSVWPQGRISELITRLILNTTGSAFAKLQLHSTELCVNDAKQVQRLIELLGGQWGKTGLEKRYADAERALFQCSQHADESHDSYLARADVLWTKLKSQKLKIEDLQAYITLRGAQLSSDDKKRIILDSDSSLEGTLTVGRVQDAVRMLGTSFFQEMTGLGKKLNKSKVYDSLTMFTEDAEHHGEQDDSANLTHHEDWNEDDLLEVLIAEGDDDAVFISDFETAASELVQSDDDLAAAYSTYIEARRKLSEKYRSRGFWPLSKGGKSKGKGKTKNKSMWSSRQSLQQRILNSNCRICGKRGHWRNECPMKNQVSSSTTSTAAVTVSLASDGNSQDLAMPAEFMNLPEIAETHAQDILSNASCFVQSAEQESIEHLTIEDLKGEAMTFGRTHLGKTFEEMWVNHPDWIKWFAAHYYSSGKIEHRRMIHFIYLKIEESESAEGSTQMPIAKAKAKSAPKSLAARPKSTASTSTLRTWDVDPETDVIDMMGEPWIPNPDRHEEIQSLQARMLSLESNMQQMMSMLAQSPLMTGRAIPTEPHLDAPAEWEDPWNN
eukprot:s2627_g6.t1